MDFIYICNQKNTILDMSYLPRIADNQLEERLEAFGAVLIEGPKWCGKTTTAEQISKSNNSICKSFYINNLHVKW